MWCCVTRATSKEGQHSPGCDAVSERGSCPNHRIISHDAEGAPEQRWCDFCGRDTAGTKVGLGAGRWS